MKTIRNDYKSSFARVRRFRLNRCPVWVLRGFGCRAKCPVMKECPVVLEGGCCDGCHKTGGMGIDHPGLYLLEDGNREYVFRPYSMTENEKRILESLCKAFGLEVEYTDNCSYKDIKDVIIRMKLPENCTWHRG